MLAIAMAFLVANTVGGHASHHPPGRPKEVCSPPALDRYHPVRVNLAVDPIDLASNSPLARASVRQQVRKTPRLAGQLGGFVIIYTGNAESPSYALTVDGYIKRILIGLGNQDFVFHNAAYLDEQIIGEPPTEAQLEVYLFEPQQCTAVPEPPAKGG